MRVFSDTLMRLKLRIGAPLNLHWMEGVGSPMATQMNCAVPASGISWDDGVGDMMEGRTIQGRRREEGRRGEEREEGRRGEEGRE